MGEVLKTSERACTVRAYLGWKHHEATWGEYYNSTPSPRGWDRYLKQAREPAQWELILVGRTMKQHGVNITTPPLPPWMGEVLKTSKRACTVRAYLGWKHHEAPRGEYYNSTPPPMDGRGTENKWEGLHSESLSWLEAPWSEYYNSTHHPTAPPCMEC